MSSRGVVDEKHFFLVEDENLTLFLFIVIDELPNMVVCINRNQSPVVESSFNDSVVSYHM